jgi:hypothetical protein
MKLSEASVGRLAFAILQQTALDLTSKGFEQKSAREFIESQDLELICDAYGLKPETVRNEMRRRAARGDLLDAGGKITRPKEQAWSTYLSRQSSPLQSSRRISNG